MWSTLRTPRTPVSARGDLRLGSHVVLGRHRHMTCVMRHRLIGEGGRDLLGWVRFAPFKRSAWLMVPLGASDRRPADTPDSIARSGVGWLNLANDASILSSRTRIWERMKTPLLPGSRRRWWDKVPTWLEGYSRRENSFDPFAPRSLGPLCV